MLGLAVLGAEAEKEKKKTPQQIWMEQISASSDEPLVDPKIVKGALLVVGLSAAFYLVSRVIK
jgi:hypothetical protein